MVTCKICNTNIQNFKIHEKSNKHKRNINQSMLDFDYFNDKNNKEIMNNYDKILNLNDEFEQAYLDVKDVKRKYSLNIHFKLFKFLQLCGVKCNISDFQKVSNKRENTLNEYNKMWKKICEINKWKLIE